MSEVQQLVEASIKGDVNAFEALVSKYANSLYAVSYSILGDHHLAQDAAQEALLRAYLHLPTLSDPAKVGSWLYSIVHRLSLDWKRNHKRAAAALGKLVKTPDPQDGPNLVEEEVLRRQTNNEVWRALETLEPTNRIPVVLYYVSGWNMRGIADFLGISVRAVESRLQRSKKILRAELASYVGDWLATRKLGAAFEQEVMRQIPLLSGIPCIYIEVRDEQKAQAWYETVLGFDFDRTPNAGAFNIAFRVTERGKEPAPYPVFVFTTPDLSQACRALRSLNISYSVLEDGNGDKISFHDPDGNMLCFAGA